MLVCLQEIEIRPVLHLRKTLDGGVRPELHFGV